jgi:putative transposase
MLFMTMSKPAAINGVSTPVDSRKRHPDLRKLPSWWTRSYFASTAGTVSAQTIARYVAAQKGL